MSQAETVAYHQQEYPVEPPDTVTNPIIETVEMLEEHIGLSNIADVFDEMLTLQNSPVNVTHDKFRSYSKYMSGILFTLHHEYSLPFDGLEYVQSLLYEHYEKLTDLNQVQGLHVIH